MKKSVVLLSLLLVIFAACFIPVTQQQTIPVKSPFLKVYQVLISPDKWKEWRPDLKKGWLTDSNKVVVQKGSNTFNIKYEGGTLGVKQTGSSFDINERDGNNTTDYTYEVVPDTNIRKTNVSVSKKSSALNYVIAAFKGPDFSDTHVGDLKNFMETDSLHYGCKIIRIKVPDSNLIVIDKEVFAKNKFNEAEKMLKTLQQFVKTHNLKQEQPIIAQFLPRGADSTQIKVGIFIDKEVNSAGEVTFMRMPKGGTFYMGRFSGKFKEKYRVYDGMHEYFTDHLYQMALIPFESYLDNKLPRSDTDRVNVRVVFPSYF